MKPVCTFCFFFFCNSVFAQSEYNYTNEFELSNLSYRPIEFTPVKGVREVAFEFISGKKKIKNFVKKYNEQGQLTEFYQIRNEKGPVLKKAMLYYDENFNLKQADLFGKKNKLDLRIRHSYNDNNQITALEKLNPDGSYKYKYTWKDNEKGCLEESTYSKKNSDEVKYILKYEYYDSCKKERTVRYDAKGKIKEEWNFLCDDYGMKQTKKNQNKLCSWHESNAEYLIMNYETVDVKGKVVKYRAKYTAKDTLILEWARYKADGEVDVITTYDKSNDKLLTRTWYKNGKPKRVFSSTYEGDLKTSSAFSRKGKQQYKIEYVYDVTGKMTELKEYGKKGKIRYQCKIKYLK